MFECAAKSAGAQRFRPAHILPMAGAANASDRAGRRSRADATTGERFNSAAAHCARAGGATGAGARAGERRAAAAPRVGDDRRDRRERLSRYDGRRRGRPRGSLEQDLLPAVRQQAGVPARHLRSGRGRGHAPGRAGLPRGRGLARAGGGRYQGAVRVGDREPRRVAPDIWSRSEPRGPRGSSDASAHSPATSASSVVLSSSPPAEEPSPTRCSGP